MRAEAHRPPSASRASQPAPSTHLCGLRTLQCTAQLRKLQAHAQLQQAVDAMWQPRAGPDPTWHRDLESGAGERLVGARCAAPCRAIIGGCRWVARAAVSRIAKGELGCRHIGNALNPCRANEAKEKAQASCTWAGKGREHRQWPTGRASRQGGGWAGWQAAGRQCKAGLPGCSPVHVSLMTAKLTPLHGAVDSPK